MTAAARIAISIACVLPAVVWARGQGQAGQGQPPVSPQTFRTATDVVMVDVSVRRGNVPVTGLKAADFDLRDNGVKQDVEAVEATAVPIDLSIVVDVSGNPDRPWVDKPRLTSTIAAGIDAQVRKLTGLLRAGDRVRLFAQDTYVQQLWPLQAATSVPQITRIDFDGQSTLYDTLTTVLLQPVEPSRRHVIVAATKGLDTISSISAVDLRAIAERSDAQMHLVMMELAADAESSIQPFQCACMDLCRPTTRFWVPARRRLFTTVSNAPSCMPGPPGATTGGTAPLHTVLADGQELSAGALATGGGFYQGEGVSEPTLYSTFAAAFENFRQSYVLRYTPRGVAREGWHRISVTVPSDKSLRISSRRGYAVDPPKPPPPPAAPPPVVGTALRTLPELIAAYDRQGYDAVSVGLRQVADPARLIREFEEGGNPWPAAPAREAAFALEIIETGLFSARPLVREDGMRALDRFARLVRHPIEPDEAERAWLRAALALLQATIRPTAAQPFATRALGRFPRDPRVVLADAIITDQLWPYSGPVAPGRAPTKSATTAAHAETVIAKFTAAAAFPETAAEALIRWAWFLHRIGKSGEALEKLSDAVVLNTGDTWLRYYRQLFSGHALAALGRQDEAIAAFRESTAIVPGSQAGRIALMNLLVAKGDRAEVATIAEHVQTAKGGIDPWWMYWQGDYRFYPQALAAARGQVR